MNDLKFALRQLLKNPGFTAVAVLTLALGIGATVAIFGIVNELLFKPRAVSRPDELAAIGFRNDNGSLTMLNISRPFYEVFDAEQRAFSDLIGFAHVRLKAETPGGSDRVRGELVSGSYFQTLGVNPVLGRTLLPSDDEKLGAGGVAVLSHEFWQRHFQSDPNIIGETIRLEGQPILIVGVAAKDFRGLDVWSADLWLPTTLEPVFQQHTVYRLVGRLAPGVSRAQAQADVERVSQYLSETYGETAPVGYERYGLYGSGRQIVLLGAGRGSVSPYYGKDSIWRAFLLFMSAGGLVLLIGCSNFSSLLLVRALKKRKETAMRLALGARPLQIVKQSVVESLFLASLAAMVGAVLAIWLNQILALWKPANVTFMAEIAPDWRVLAFCVVTALGTGFVFGLVPALQSLRFEVFPALKKEGTADSGSRGRFRLKHWLVAGQLALCLVLLLGAGLCLKSFGKLLGVDPGFDTRKTIVAELNLEQAGYTPETAPATLLEIIQRVQSVPGVTHATFSSNHPLSGWGIASYDLTELEGYESRPGERIEFNTAQVGPDFFRTVGIPLLQGTELSMRDFGLNQQIALVNESFVRRYWPDQKALGKRVLGQEVIGIVKDSRVFDLPEEPAPLVFQQAANLSGLSTHLLIRTDGNAGSVLSSVAAALRSWNPKFSSVTPRTMREILLNSLGAQRYTLTLIAGFASAALILSAVGVYGVMSYVVSLMTKEVGIRLALGAQRRAIVRLVLGFGLRVVGLGTLLGVPCAAIATRFIRSELYQVHPLNPLVLLGAAALLGVVALSACWLPARRAARVDPMEALRTE